MSILGKRFRAKNGTVWVPVNRVQKKQTQGKWVNNVPEVETWIYTFGEQPPMRSMVTLKADGMEAHWDSGHLLLCNVLELDEETNEFGPISP